MLSKRNNILLVVVLLFCIGSKRESFAITNETPVVIEALLPENQIDKSVKYFDLRLKPSDKQKVSIKITNISEKPINFKLVYSNAKTTSEGVIEYSENHDLKLNTPSGYSFVEVVSGPSELVIPAKDSKEAEFQINMPKESYDGSIAGGVEFIQEVDQKEQGALVAQRSYLVGFKLTETDKKLPVDIDLGKTMVGIKNYKNAIVVPMINLTGEYVEELSVNTEIIDESNQTIVLQSEKKKMRMAPYSTLELPLYIEDGLLDVGDYGIRVKVTAKGNFSKDWQQSFTVTNKDREIMKENQKLWLGNRSLYKTVFFLLLIITLVTLLAVSFKIKHDFKKKKKKGANNGKKKKH